MIAYCGLDCDSCDVRQAAQDPEKARILAEAFHAEGYPDAVPGWFRCQGCMGPEDLVWDGGCDMRTCCMKKQFSNCAACGEFPCAHALKFEADDGTHAAAIGRLRALRENRE
jgi:hypothetical protein